MSKGGKRIAYYVAFVVGVSAGLAPHHTPNLIPFDYGNIAGSYGGLLASLGGFAITVLAVLLGLEALDTQRSTRSQVAAHGVVLRHVSLSLAIASVVCFVGALLLGEVGALASSIDRAKVVANQEVERSLRSMGLSQARVAGLLNEQDRARRDDPWLVGISATQQLVQRLGEDPKTSATSEFASLQKRAVVLDETLNGSMRRHLVIANVVALLCSILILKSITFLLVMRFPSYPSISGVQDFVVLGFGGMILIKLLYTAQVGMSDQQLAMSPYAVAGVLLVTIFTYRTHLRKKVDSLRKDVIQGDFGDFTPAAPYLFVLFACLGAKVYLALTFDHLGPLTDLDRLLVGLVSLIGTALLVTVQIERPTLDLFKEADRFGSKG